MIPERRILVLTFVVVAVVLVGAIYFLPRYRARNMAETAVASYNNALAAALRDVNPNLLDGYVDANEKTRVTAYMSQLAGEGVFMDASLLDSKVEQIVSEPPTVTVKTTEQWRYVKRDKKTGTARGAPVEDREVLIYTLVPQDGRLVVHESLFAEGSGEKP